MFGAVFRFISSNHTAEVERNGCFTLFRLTVARPSVFSVSSMWVFDCETS